MIKRYELSSSAQAFAIASPSSAMSQQRTRYADSDCTPAPNRNSGSDTKKLVAVDGQHYRDRVCLSPDRGVAARYL